MAWQQRTVHLLLLLSGAALATLAVARSVPLVGSQRKFFSLPWSMRLVGAVPYRIAPLHAQFCQAHRSNFVVAAVQKVGPAVVRINAARYGQAPGGFDDPLLRRFFGSEPSAPPSRRVEAVPDLDSLSIPMVRF